jgi:predicted PurR-regulated permease PerM
MLRIVIAILFFIIGLFGCEYFSHYHGTVIPMPWLWLIVSLMFIAIAARLLYSFQKSFVKKISSLPPQLKQLKQTGQRIIVNLDNCDFKLNNYTEEIVSDDFSRGAVFSTMAQEGSDYSSHSVSQTAFIYMNKEDDKQYRLISQAFSMDETTLKYHIMAGHMILYIDRLDKKNYFFELNN